MDGRDSNEGRTFLVASWDGRVDEVQQLRVEVRCLESGALVRLEGEVDMATAKQLDIALRELPRLRVTVDLSGLTFMDSSGLNALVRAHREFAAEGGELSLEGARQNIRKVFEVSGLTFLLTE